MQNILSERLIVLTVTDSRNNYWDLLHEEVMRSKFIFYRLKYFISLTVFQDSVCRQRSAEVSVKFVKRWKLQKKKIKYNRSRLKEPAFGKEIRAL